MNPVTRKAALLLLLTGLFLSACEGSLWGSYAPYLTPDPTATEPATPTATASPSPTPVTPTPTATPTSTPSGPTSTPGPSVLYLSQSGDSLDVVAARFGVEPQEITAASPLPAAGFLNPGTPLVVPGRPGGTPATPSERIFPDSEVVFSPSAVGFDVAGFLNSAGGNIGGYHRRLPGAGWITFVQAVQTISYESSLNPRLLLALVQDENGWVKWQSLPGQGGLSSSSGAALYNSLYIEMRLAVQDVVSGYYGWRSGKLTALTFPDGTTLRLAPDLNAGSVALQYFFSKRLNYAEWLRAVDPQEGFRAAYADLFGDPWERARTVEPLFPAGLTQPDFTLPFEPGVVWSFTGGPHPAWEQESGYAALDFAPAISGCGESNAWVLASVPGQVVRSGGGYVLLDLDGDGFEQTGWVVLYMHIASKDRIPAGARVDAGDRLGHPSCEGGLATGTHLHIARKYNGEWVEAGGPLPFVLSGWMAHSGGEAYKGWLTRGERTIRASQSGASDAVIVRLADE